MTKEKNGQVFGRMTRGFYGRKNSFPMLFIAASVLIMSLAGCRTPPPLRPALSQSVINIQRSTTRYDTGKLYIYVDDQIINEKAPILKGQFVSYPVNNGVHYIHGVCGKYVSEAINFSASSKTVSFTAEIVKEPGLFGKTKLVINRSEVIDDTGRQTDLDIQEGYGNL